MRIVSKGAHIRGTPIIKNKRIGNPGKTKGRIIKKMANQGDHCATIENITSEVGCNSDTYGENDSLKWKMLLEQQNKNFAALVAVMQNTTAEGINLPEFNPNTVNSDARAWISTADLCIPNKQSHGPSLMSAISKAMKGEASSWMAQVSYAGMTWADFKDLFMERFQSAETTAGFLIGVNQSRPRNGECLAAHAATLVTSLTSRLKDLPVEHIAVAFVLTHLAQLEPRVQRLAFTTPIENREQLQRELKVMSFMKRSASQMEAGNYDSKHRNIVSVTCFKCNKPGHKAAQCRSGSTSTSTMYDRSAQSKIMKSSVTCFNCKEVGHYASSCPKKVVERRVDVCTKVVPPPAGLMQHLGENFQFIYDSGAECSLIQKTVSFRLRGELCNNVVNLTGLGHATVSCANQILSTVKINNINVKILFHVMPDYYLRYNIMLGREILEQGLRAVMVSGRVDFDKILSVDTCEKQLNCEEKFDCVDTDLTKERKVELVSLLMEFKFHFISGFPSKVADVEPMKINLIDPQKTVYRRPYRLSCEEKEIVREKVSELLNAGLIRPSHSPFASPILLVKKKDNSDRMCVDYRESNDNTIPERFPLPLISDQIDRLQKGKYFSTLDMASGYHQVRVHADSVERTAFVTPEGHYEYVTMPFGLRNAPAVFQRAVMSALGSLVNDYVVVYMDDIVVVGSSVEESLERLRKVIRILTEKGFSFNLKKCAFLKTKIEYLGYEVTNGEIRPNNKKVEALTALPAPENVHQLRQFIGLASYFRKFIPKFSQIMTPLFALTSGNGSIKWESKHELVKKKIVRALTNDPILMIFDPNCPIELHTDASAVGYGAMLMQTKQDRLRVVAYFSKRTTPAESKYHSYELETPRHYLHGRSFTVYTDCNALSSSRNKKNLTPRFHRWWAFLQAFEFQIVYRKGNQMSHVDILSRNPLPLLEKGVLKKVEWKRVNLAELTNNWLLAEQQRDTEIRDIIADWENKELNKELAKTYEVRSGILYRKVQRNGRTLCLAMVPRSFRWSILNNVHEALMHLGWEKTLDKLYESYWFENMAKFTRKFVDNCVTCQVSKNSSGKIQAQMHPIPKVPIPWHTLLIDITGKLSGKNDRKEYVFVLIDAFTKYVLLFHTLAIDTASAILVLKQSSSLFGAPTRIIADQGRCFASEEFRKFCTTSAIELHLIATGSARANGQVERVMGTLKNMLTAAESGRQSWQDALKDVQLAINCTKSKVTKYSPLELLVGKVARPLALISVNDDVEVDIPDIRREAEKNMKRMAEYSKQRFDVTKAKIKPYEVGDLVLLQNEERNQVKLDTKYKGPFQILEILHNDRYLMRGLNSNRTYKYAHDRIKPMPQSQVLLDNGNDELVK